MENNQRSHGYFCQFPVCNRILSTEVSSDFSLPDYKSEMRKLLSTKVKLMPPKKYVGNGAATVEGELIYKILYVGADGSPYCATLSDKYRFDADLDFNEHSLNSDEVFFDCFCECESVSTHVLGPRKINLKSKLSCKVLALSPAIYSPELVGEHDGATVENRVLECSSILLKSCESEPISLSDLISIDPQIDNIRIIETSTRVMVSECAPSTNALHVRGEVYAKILYCNDAQSDEALCFFRKLPFSTSIPCEGVGNSFECCAYGTVTDESFRIEENGISIELLLTLCAELYKNVPTPYVYDAFSTERVCENESAEVEYLSFVKALCGNLTQSESFSLSELKIDPDAKIIDADAKAHVDSMSIEKGKALLLGECHYHLLLCNDGEYWSCDVSAPLRYEMDMRAISSEISPELLCAKPEVLSVRSRCDGERIFLDCELNFCISILAKSKIKALKKVTFGEKLQKAKGKMTLCYPHTNASLWDIAKQYGEPLEKLRMQNSIGEDHDISKKKFLVI